MQVDVTQSSRKGWKSFLQTGKQPQIRTRSIDGAAARNLEPKVIELSRCAISTSAEARTFRSCRVPWTQRTPCLLMDLPQSRRTGGVFLLRRMEQQPETPPQRFSLMAALEVRGCSCFPSDEGELTVMTSAETRRGRENERRCELPTAAQRAVWCSDVEINYWCGACSHLITNLIRTLQNEPNTKIHQRKWYVKSFNSVVTQSTQLQRR